jgi:tetratricopeptide (TPR) repeat protein
MAGRQGFEPRSDGPEPPVLPLDDLPALRVILEKPTNLCKAKPAMPPWLPKGNPKGIGSNNVVRNAADIVLILLISLIATTNMRKTSEHGRSRSYMRRYFKIFVIIMMALAPAFFPKAGSQRALAAPQAKPANKQPAVQEQDGATDEEIAAYKEWEDIKNEPDYKKRAEMLKAWVPKYPKSNLMPQIRYEYDTLLILLQKEEKWALLQSTAEDWSKLFPDDPDKVKKTFMVAMAAGKLGNFELCAECLEECYAKQPSGEMAHNILDNYKEVKKLAKIIEWSEKIFKMPEYDGEYGLRYYFVPLYSSSKNMPEAIKYCRLTLKSADALKEPNEDQKKQLPAVRYGCHVLIGTDLYDTQKKYADAAKEFDQAAKYKRTSLLYYYGGMCRWNLQDIDNAILYFAAAEIIGDEPIYKQKAKEQMEKLYKSKHDDSTIGIEKRYKEAKEMLLK